MNYYRIVICIYVPCCFGVFALFLFPMCNLTLVALVYMFRSWWVMSHPAHKGSSLQCLCGFPLVAMALTRLDHYCGSALCQQAAYCASVSLERRAPSRHIWGSAVRSEDSWSSLITARMRSDLSPSTHARYTRDYRACAGVPVCIKISLWLVIYTAVADLTSDLWLIVR